MIRKFLRNRFLVLTLAVAALVGVNAVQQSVEARDKVNSDKLLIAKAETISWYTDLNQALRAAGSSRKWVLVDFYTDWCQPCKVLDEKFYGDPKIIEYLNQSFVCLKVNGEKGDGIAVKTKYGVEVYPSTYVLDPSGKEKGRIIGYYLPTRLQKELTRIVRSK